MKEFKKLNVLSKGIIETEHQRKINSLSNLEEKKQALKFLLLSHLKLRHLELGDLLEESKNHEDFHVLFLKSSLIPLKIILLQENFEEKDFKKIIALIDEIELRLLGDGFI